MTNIYRAKDLAELFDKITTNSIGLDRTIQNFWGGDVALFDQGPCLFSVQGHSTRMAIAADKRRRVPVICPPADRPTCRYPRREGYSGFDADH